MLSRPARLSLFLCVGLLAGGFLFSAPHVFAQTSEVSQVAATAGLESASLVSIIGRIIAIILGLMGVLFLILVIYGGIVWMTAMGDEKKITKAKNILVQAIVGLFIVLASYGITTFVINAITGGGGLWGSNTDGGNSNAIVSVVSHSGARGLGPIRDHYPERDQLEVARNTRISITFKDPIDPATITTSSVKVYPLAAGAAGALTGTAINSVDNLTFVFRPSAYLGSPDEKVNYVVYLTQDIKTADGNKIFASSSAEYQWSFTTGTFLDLTPPTLTGRSPDQNSTKDRNILVQMSFSEAIDPMSATGKSDTFSNIEVAEADTKVSGAFSISNSYTTVTFTPTDPCGTNSCGQTIYCLPGNAAITTTIKSPAATIDPPQADAFPYAGIVDMAGNAFDGDKSTASSYENYVWNFNTTSTNNLFGPSILTISPNIAGEDVPLDQPIAITFSDVLNVSSVSQDTIQLSNVEMSTGESHEMWFSPSTSFLDGAGTLVEVRHGTFLESVDGKSYMYGTNVTSALTNEYQNCYAPGSGPDKDGLACAVTNSEPFCCNGVASANDCVLFQP